MIARALPAVVLLAGAGCASISEAPPPPATGIEVVSSRAPSGAVAAGDLCPAPSVTWVFAPIEGEGSDQTFVFEATNEHDADTRFATDDGRAEFWTHDDDGTVRLAAVLEPGKHALSLFTPPLLVAPGDLVAGTEVSDEVDMRVVDARRPTRQREVGRARRTIRFSAVERLRTPHGDYDAAQRVEITFDAELRLTRVGWRGTFWVVPGLGVVARVHEQTVVVLGVETESERAALVKK